jgi:hypothetical protein
MCHLELPAAHTQVVQENPRESFIIHVDAVHNAMAVQFALRSHDQLQTVQWFRNVVTMATDSNNRI